MYNYKVYNKNGVYKFTINPTIIKNNVSFSANINGGQGQMSLVLNSSIDSTYGDILKIYRKGNLIYTGVFQNKNTNFSENGIEYSYPILGLVSILSMVLYGNGSLNQDPGLTARQLVDSLNTIYNLFSWTVDSIPLYGSSVKIDFTSSDTFLDCFKKCYEVMGRYLFVDKNGLVTIKDKGTTKDYSVTLGRELYNLDIEENSENIKNNIEIKYTGSSITRSDTASITIHGRRDYFEEKTDYNNATAIEYAENLLANNKDVKIKVSGVFIRTENFDFDNVTIGDIVKINNTKNSLGLLQIVKYSYNEENIKIDFEDFDSFGKEILLLTGQ